MHKQSSPQGETVGMGTGQMVELDMGQYAMQALDNDQ